MSSGSGEPTPIESHDDLVELISRGSKPRDARRIGVEHEKFGIFDETLAPLPYTNGIETVLEGLAEITGWSGEYAGNHLIALKGDGASVTLEPGGQLELSGAPLLNVAEVEAELTQHLDAVSEVSRALPGLRWLFMGARPTATLDDVEWVPKPRYGIMRRYLPTRGSLAHYMMKMSCTVQANFDFTSEEDAADILATVLAVTPITSAIFATSPFLRGEPTGHITSRCHFWTDTDPDRTGYLRGMLEPGYTFDDYVEYLLDMPMFFIERGDEWLDCTHLTFRRFLADGHAGHRALVSDWGLHMSTAFPEVRLKQYIEVRGCDCAPVPMMLGFSALWLGLLYSEDARKRARALTASLSFEDRLAVHHAMIDSGLETKLPDGTPLSELARELLRIARRGLNDENRADDARYLDWIDERVTGPGKSLAAQALSVYKEHDLRTALEPFFL